eukprot:jgi/Tetstr1/432234/TSEL_002270.t1
MRSDARHVALTADGNRLAIGDWADNIKILDTSTGSVLQSFRGYIAYSDAVPLSMDGTLLALGTVSNAPGIHGINLWDVSTGVLLRTLMIPGHDELHSVALSGNGRLVAAGLSKNGAHHTAQLWDTASGALLHTLNGHAQRLVAMALSEDGRLLATGSLDRTVKLWDTATGALLHALDDHTCADLPNCCLALGDNGSLLATAGGEFAQLYNTSSGARLDTPDDTKRHSHTVTSVALSADGHLLATGSLDGSAKLWSTDAMAKGTTGGLLHTFQQPQPVGTGG